MARLIDADALKEEIEFHPTSVSVCMTVAEAKGQTYFKNRCLEDIDNAPTIDAIPVEWLENRLNTLCFEAMGACALYGDRIGELAKSINEVLKLWQKEQEAQDG
jgi:hypothetical protein